MPNHQDLANHGREAFLFSFLLSGRMVGEYLHRGVWNHPYTLETSFLKTLLKNS